VALQRLLVPLDPSRYYELGRVAEANFDGRCLDVSSPKLLPSLLQREGCGRWTCIDLFVREIEAWAAVDPSLELEVADATGLPYGDASFDHAICVSVIEHIPGDGDTAAMAELWRVLKPGGVLHLTTNVAARSHDVYREAPVYGATSTTADGRAFFERRYSADDLERRLLGDDWRVLTRELCRQQNDGIETRFYERAPWSYAYGGALRLWCPQNFQRVPDTAALESRDHGIAYMVLQKPPGS
jgi:SAM-dependent methyltransferase